MTPRSRDLEQFARFSYTDPMSTTTLIEMQARLQRLERQNRVLILLLLGFAGIGSIAVTNRHPTVITADEIRTPFNDRR